MTDQQGLAAFLRSRGSAFYGSDRIFLAPDIPLKKLSGAAATVSMWARPNEIAVLVDDTVFGGAKEGVFFTDTWVILKSLMEDSISFQLAEVEHLAADGRTLYINYNKVISLNLPEKHELAALIDAINAYIQTLKTPSLSGNCLSPVSQVALNAGFPYYRYAGFEVSPWFEQHMSTLTASNSPWLDDPAYRQLLLRILQLSSSLREFCGSGGITLTGEQWTMLNGDAMRLEVYFYLIAHMKYLLVSSWDLTEEDAIEFVTGVAMSMMIPCIENFEADLFKRPHVAASVSMFEDSILMNEFEERRMDYDISIASYDIQNLSTAFIECLSKPSFLKLVADPSEMNAIAAATQELVQREIQAPVIAEFMLNMNAILETAMAHFFETTRD